MRRQIPLFSVLAFIALLQSTIFPLNLVLVAILLLVFLSEKLTDVLILAFCAGLFLDFLSSTTLGISSLLFLFMVLLIFLGKKTGLLVNFLAFLAAAFVIFLSYDWVLAFINFSGLNFNFQKTSFETVLLFLGYPFFNRLLKRISSPDILQLSFKEKLR